jgi:hypothetical protein
LKPFIFSSFVLYQLKVENIYQFGYKGSWITWMKNTLEESKRAVWQRGMNEELIRVAHHFIYAAFLL